MQATKLNVAVAILAIGVAIILASGQLGQASASSYTYSCSYSNYGDYSYYYYPYSYYTYPYCSYGSYGYSPYYGYSYPYYSSYYNSYYSYPYYSSYYGSPYYLQYQLTVKTDPANIAQVTGGGSYGQGTYASFGVTQNVIQVNSNSRYVLSHWSGDYSGVGSGGALTMNGPRTVVAVYQIQYYLTVNVQPANAPLASGSGWYDAGDTATLTMPAATLSGDGGSRLAFQGWSIDGASTQTGPTLSLTMNGPHTVSAQYQQQYFLTVISDQGTTYGQGWYNAGSSAQIYVSTPSSPSYGVNMVFSGWQGDIQSGSQSTQVSVNKPMTAIATWRTDATVLDLTITLGIVAVAGSGIATLGHFILKRRSSHYEGIHSPVGSNPTVNTKPNL